MKNHLINVGFFGLDLSDTTLLMVNTHDGTYKYTIDKYDKIFNIHLKNIKTKCCDFINIHCMCLVYAENNTNSFDYIRNNFENLKETSNLHNEITNCTFILVCIREPHNIICANMDEIDSFVIEHGIFSTNILRDDFSNFTRLFNQILKIQFLDEMNTKTVCVLT
jgi:hypothetical protein